MKILSTVIVIILTASMASAVTATEPSVYVLAAKGELAKIKMLAAKDPSVVDSRDKSGASPLHFAAAAGQKTVAEYLLNRKVDVNAKKKNGVTPLHAAAALGKAEVVKLLLSRSADVNACDDQGRTPLSVAEANHRAEVVKLLLADVLKPAVREPAKDPGTPKPLDPAIMSRQLVEILSRRDYESMTATFDSKLKETLSAEGLKQMWESLLEDLGEYKGQLGVRTSKADGKNCVVVTCQFEAAKLDVQFVFDEANQVSSFALLPVEK